MDSRPQKQDRRRDNAVATRAALIRSARHLFGRHGFEKTSLAQICAEAGATTGSLYHHFGDKVGMFRAVFEQIDTETVESCTQAFAAAMAATNDPWESLIAANARAIELGILPGTRRIFFIDAPTVFGGSGWLSVHERCGYGAMIALVSQMQESGMMIPGDPRQLALMIEYAAFAAVLTLPEDIELARQAIPAAQQSVRAMLSGLRAKPAGGPATG